MPLSKCILRAPAFSGIKEGVGVFRDVTLLGRYFVLAQGKGSLSIDERVEQSLLIRNIKIKLIGQAKWNHLGNLLGQKLHGLFS
jgi:hypothetical protein